MPNWCYNSLLVQGPVEDMERFVKAVTLPENDGAKSSGGDDAGVYDFTLLYPTPKELAETTSGHYTKEPNSNWAVMLAKGEMTQEWYDELVRNNAEGWKKDQENLAKYGYANWYDWNCDNWGTKWSPRVTDLELDYQYKQINSHFETAWCPATGLFAKISELFPTLIFEITSDEESEAFVCCEIFHKGQVFGKDYDPYNAETLPDHLRDEIVASQKKLEETDFSDDNWSDLRIELSDLYNQLRDEAETEASKSFLAEHPNAYK